MHWLDWLVLIATLSFIIIYGIVKSRGAKNIETYLLADRKMPWYHVGLSVMATQASAITFLSAPGQGFTDGLRFVQFYFGLPLAMIVLCITFIPAFAKQNVYTAYEFVEKRFDNKTRYLTAFLFLFQRGLSTGITIYAPAIILSTILNIPLYFTIILNGVLVILYTVYGGAKAVSYTQLLQMAIIFTGLFITFYLVLHYMPANVNFADAMYIASKSNKTNAIETKLNWNNKYNLWSGIIGGFFLQLSYFGTDQSQVGRYLTGKNIAESRMGLILNAMVKIPMQFFILLIGVMVFVFYNFNAAPIFYNDYANKELLQSKAYQVQIKTLLDSNQVLQLKRQSVVANLLLVKGNTVAESQQQTSLNAIHGNMDSVKKLYKKLIKQNNKLADDNDSNYIFLYFVTHTLPKGIVGLLMAVIFLAAMGSTASGLNSLASSTVVDFYKPIFNANGAPYQYLKASKLATLAWGLFCIIVAFFASKLGSLIEAVNVLGSLFYGNILGVFIVGFYIKFVKSNAIFTAAIITQVLVFISFKIDFCAFLWLNVLGCLSVVFCSIIIQKILDAKQSKQ